VAAQLAKATAPHTATVQGRTLTWQARPTAIAFDDLGVTADVEANVTMPAAAGAPASPGSLSTVGVPPTMGNQAGVQAAIDDDAVNRALWAAWQGGLTTLALDQATVAQIAGPNFPFRLEAALLTRFLPSLAGRLNPTDPVELDVSSLLPPVVRVTGTPDLVEMGMGEVATDIYVIEQGRRRLVLSVAAHVKVGASVGYSAGAVQVSFGNAPTVRANILASPVAAVDARNLESMLQTVLPSVLQLATGFGGGGRFPLPPIPGGLQVLNLRTYATGPALDYLGASFDLR
ncbi:MAG: hypothetical protein HY722_13795, partial [Planctomycetes bacterium]|nr:hypothetical protein [Planctomycetota bacterium]